MRRKLTWLVLLGAAIVVIVEIPVFGANQFVIHVDSNATPDGNGSAKFPTTICLRRSRRARNPPFLRPQTAFTVWQIGCLLPRKE